MANQDLGGQAALYAKINELIDTAKKGDADREKILSSQLKLMLGIKDAADGTAKGYERAQKRLDEIAKSEEKVAAASEKAAGAQKDFTAEIKKAADESEEMNKRLEKASKIAGMFGDAMSDATTSTMGLLSAGGNLIGMIANVGQAILAVPFKLWDAFIEKSKGMPYNPAFAQMKEDVREMFGSLKSGAGKQVMGAYRELRSEMGTMSKEAGLSMGKIFGYGVEGKAAMLSFIKDMSQGLGSQLGPILNQVGASIGEVTYAIKGMGLSNEEAGTAMKFFYNSGQNAKQMLVDMGKTAAMMAKQTGFNVKTLSKAMVETTTAFPQFAKQGVKAMAEIAHYTHNLGIEVKDLQAVFEKFDSFDAAAESASQLSQAFGVNIDAMKMVKEQSPTKRLEELRNAFKAAGKDINNMTSAERKLAEQTVGLTGAAFEAALGEGNKKKTLSESEKAAQAATKAAKEQTKAMKELAESIKRIIPPQAEKFDGFFDAFSKGFGEGLYFSESFGGMMRDIQSVFRQIFLLGRDIGRILPDMFPGIKQIAKGFHEIFNPTRFAKFREKAVEIFKLFFKDIETDPKAGFQKFFDRMKKLLGELFGDKAGGGLTMLKEGFEKFTSVLGRVLGEAMKKLIEMVTEGIRNFTDMIKNPNKVTDTAATAGGFMKNLFEPMWEALKEMGPALGEALMALLEIAFEKLKPWLMKAAGILAMWWTGKFVAQLAMSFAMEWAKAKITEMITGKSKDAMTKALEANTEALNKMSGQSMPGPASRKEDTRSGLKKMIDGLNRIKETDILKAGVRLFLMGTVLLINLGLFGAGLNFIASKISFVDLAINSLLLIPVALALAALGGALWVLSKVELTGAQIGKILGLVLGLGVIMGGLAFAVVAGMSALKNAPSPSAGAAFALVIVALAGALATIGLATAAIAKITENVPPKAIAIAVLVIAALGYVMMQLSIIATGALLILSAVFSEETAKKAILVSQAFSTFTEGMVHMGQALMYFALASLNPFTIFSTMLTMSAVVDKFAEVMPDMVDKIMKSTAGISVEEVKGKMEAMNALAQSLSPIAQIAGTFGSIAVEMADEDYKESEIDAVMTNLQGALTTILDHTRDFVKTLVDKAATLSPAQVSAAQAVGTLLGGVGPMMQAMMDPLNKIMEVSKERIGSRVDPETFKTTFQLFRDQLHFFLPVIGEIFDDGGPMSKLIGLVSKMEGFSTEQAEKVKPMVETIKTMMDATKLFINGFTEKVDQVDADGNKTGKQNVAAIGGLKDTLDFIIKMMFETPDGFVPKIAEAVKKIVIPEALANQLEKVGNFMKILMDPIIEIVKIVPPMMKDMLNASKGITGQVDTEKLKVMKDVFIDMIGGVIKSFLPIADMVKPLIEGILKAASTIKGDPKTLTPKLDMVLKAIEFVGKIAETFKADSNLSGIKDIGAGAGEAGSLMSAIPGMSTPGAGEKKSNLEIVVDNMRGVIDRLFGKDNKGPIQELINAMDGIKIPETMKDAKGVVNIGKVFDAMKSLFEALKAIPAESNINWGALDANLADYANLLSNQEKGFQKLLKALTPELGAQLKAAPFTTVQKNVANMSAMLSEIEKIPAVNPPVLNFDAAIMKKNMDVIVEFANKVKDGVKGIDGKDMEKMKVVASLMNNVNAGKLEVEHNLKAVQMSIYVSLDSKELAKSLINVDVSADTNKPRRVSYEERNVSDDVGFSAARR